MHFGDQGTHHITPRLSILLKKNDKEGSKVQRSGCDYFWSAQNDTHSAHMNVNNKVT